MILLHMLSTTLWSGGVTEFKLSKPWLYLHMWLTINFAAAVPVSITYSKQPVLTM